MQEGREYPAAQKFCHMTLCSHVISLISVTMLNDAPFGHVQGQARLLHQLFLAFQDIFGSILQEELHATFQRVDYLCVI